MPYLRQWSQRNEQHADAVLITRVNEYFQHLTKENADDDETKRFDLIKALFMARATELKRVYGYISIPNDVLEKIYRNYKASLDEDDDIIMPQHGWDKSALLFTTELRQIYSDITKIAAALKDKANPLYQACRGTWQIVWTGSKQEHAEMRLLGKIIQDKLYESQHTYESPNKLMIGISLLCCRHCRLMLQSANERLALQNNKTNIVFRGYHDLAFKRKKGDDKWVPPILFEEGYEAGKELTEVIGDTDLKAKDLSFQIFFHLL
jgi:hypothetical protein